MAREFSRDRISPRPFPNEIAPLTDEYKKLQAGGFAEWKLSIDGLVHQPTSFSLADLKSLPSRSHITELTCEEGWSYIAEWHGVPLSTVLDAVGVHPDAKYVVYVSTEPDTWDSIDMSDALHPQTYMCYGMNGSDLLVAHGGPSAYVRAAPDRLQEPQVHKPSDRHGRSEAIRQRMWRGRMSIRLRLVHRYLRSAAEWSNR